MSVGGLLFAQSAMQAVSQIQQGYAQKAEAKYNSTLLEGKANLIEIQKQIESGQYNRLSAQYMSKSVAAVAGSGLMLSGSPLAVMLDTQKQIRKDQAIGQFNLEQEKQYTLEEANAYRRSGRQAVKSGYAGAFSSLLQGATSYAMYKGYKPNMGGGGVSRYGNSYGINTPSGTFDMGTYSSLPGRG